MFEFLWGWFRSSGKLNDFFLNYVIRYTDRMKDGMYFIPRIEFSGEWWLEQIYLFSRVIGENNEFCLLECKIMILWVVRNLLEYLKKIEIKGVCLVGICSKMYIIYFLFLVLLIPCKCYPIEETFIGKYQHGISTNVHK